MHRREASAGDQVGHVAAQVGVDDLRAGHAENGAHLFGGHVADFENSGLSGFDQKHGFVADFGLHGGGDADFKQAFGDGHGVHTELDVNAGLLLFEQDGGGIGLLQRRFFEVHALDLENGVKISAIVGRWGVGISHLGSFWSSGNLPDTLQYAGWRAVQLLLSQTSADEN